MSDKQVPLKERISYGLGGTASEITFGMITTYLMFFYTDVSGLSTAAVGTLFLVARVFDAFDSPIIGMLIDRTSTKWGKSRPYFLWLAIPFGVVAVLTFTVPDLSESGRLIYAYVTYIILGIMYAAIDLPLSSLLPSITSSSQERIVVNAFRGIGGKVGLFIVSGAALPLVAFFGQGDQQDGFLYTMILFASVSVVLYFITFANTRERVQVNGNKPIPFKEGVKALRGNLPWLILLFVNVLLYIAIISSMQSTIYFLTYNLNREDLIPLINGLTVLMVVGTIAAPFLAKKIGKRNTLVLGFIITSIGQVVIYIGAEAAAIPILIIGRVVGISGLGLAVGLKFAMIADTVDYGEWKSGVRAPGLLMAASIFGVKIGMGLGGAISAWTMSAGGYVANQQQSSSTLLAIEFNFIWIPLIGCILSIILVMFYRLEKEEAKIMEVLKEKHNAMV
ncbi:MFS transporter [Bacillus thuringiensis]|nr:MFS transporter [Bacillus thuringiensis]